MELKPCPFCGREARVVNTGRGVFAVGCNNVRCRGDWVTAKCSWDENVAIEAWNRRAERTCRAVMAASKIASNCSECGEMLANWSMRYCPNCGRRITDDRQGD